MSRILVAAAVREELTGFDAPAAQVRCLITGMGRERAVRALERSLGEERFDLVVSTGFAGGTRSGFKVGDLVMASEVVDAVSGMRRRPDPKILGLKGIRSVGPVVTAETLLAHPEDKARMGARYGAVAVDLETAAIAELAQLHHIPWAGVRAILDPMEVPISIQSRREGVACLFRPSQWGVLSDFLRDMRLASRALSQGLNRLVAAQAVKISKRSDHSS